MVAKPHHSLDLPTAQDHCLAKSQSVSQSPHSNPSSASPPDLRVRRSNAILGPHAIGMSSHASYTPSPFTLHSITPAQSWSPSTCQIMERAASPERSTAAIYRIPTSRHPSTYPPYSHDPMSPSCWSLNGPISAFDASIQFSQRQECGTTALATTKHLRLSRTNRTLGMLHQLLHQTRGFS